MKKQLAFTCALVLGMIPVFACSFGDLVGSNAPSTAPTIALLPTIAPFPTVPLLPTIAPLPTSQRAQATSTTAAATSGKILYQDALADSKSAWQTKKQDCCEWLYVNGAYHIRVFKNNFTVYSLLPNQTFDDASIEVDLARESALAEQHLYGLGCRVSADYSQGYIFLMNSDSGHVIIKVTGDNRKELVFGKQSSAIHPAAGVNHLRADCVRDTMTFFANGVKLLETKDTDYKKGQPGVVVLSQGNNTVDVRFQNFSVRTP